MLKTIAVIDKIKSKLGSGIKKYTEPELHPMVSVSIPGLKSPTAKKLTTHQGSRFVSQRSATFRWKLPLNRERLRFLGNGPTV